MKNKRIGMIVAITREIMPVLARFGTPLRKDKIKGYEVYIYQVDGNHIHIVQSGPGEIYAAATTQMLIDYYDVGAIINVGICGGLTDDATLFKAVVVDKVVHYDYDTSAVDACEVARYQEYSSIYIPVMDEALFYAPQGLERVTCASGDKFIADKVTKTRLREAYNATVCEMEAAGILLTANRSKVPTLLVKVVSDSFAEGPNQYQEMADQTTEICAKIITKIIGGTK